LIECNGAERVFVPIDSHLIAEQLAYWISSECESAIGDGDHSRFNEHQVALIKTASQLIKAA
jgi:hypothetical protein